jgi:iron complex transport system ATP-binding protein
MIKNDNILSTKHLYVGYRKGKNRITVLNDLDLNLKKGELVCLIGPNGSGKSTLIRTLSKVQTALTGDIYIKGKKLQDYSRTEIAKTISLVLTEKVDNVNLSVSELVALGRYPHTDFTGNLSKDDNSIIKSAIISTHLEDISSKKVNELSDGQLQKVMIARALAQEGELMILDEPTAHLDLNNRVEIMTLLKYLAKDSGKAILVSTHDLDLALETADLLWICNDQKIISGTPEDLALNGNISSIFRSNLYHFDITKGRFLVHKNRHSSISLGGNITPEILFWTKHALEKAGFEIKANCETEVIVSLNGNNSTWKIKKGESEVMHNSLKDVVNYLKQN